MTRISRRGLLTSGAAAGVLAASGLPLRAQTRKGGRLRAGLSGAHGTDSWDARTHRDTFMMACAQGAVFDCLTEVKADGTLTGELATDWATTPDARTWSFNLRSGVRFHNGKAFGADDVIESLRLHLEDGTASPVRNIVAAITDMTKTGERQVQFTLAQGNADFPYLLSDYHLLIYPAGQIQESIAKGIGTGLYRVQSFAPGERLTATRVPDHYKGDNVGHFDEIEYIAMNDAAERMTALHSGEVDAINRINPAARAAVEADAKLRVREVSGNQHYSFPMLTKASALGDVNLRKALKHGIDRQSMVDKILLGHGRVGNDTPIGPANQYFAADLAPLPYDPDKARYHLKQAGLDRLDITLSASNAAFEGALEAAGLYQASAATGGIHIDVVSERADGYWSDVWMQKPFCASGWSGRATEDWMFATAYDSAAPWNDSQWSGQDSARFQSLLKAARVELDSMKRREMYREMQVILRDDGGVIVPMFANELHAVSRKIASPHMLGNLWQMDNARMAERWWMA
ncbi:ABC transporter substrate-binding protein [Sagittula sp. NFXS13]|uniref:ABC transporter substrate-binding protein n=1 Tax=Sagittula sp. NFXS13 TaxID=2819095 RepID=UPI0032DEF7C8